MRISSAVVVALQLENRGPPGLGEPRVSTAGTFGGECFRATCHVTGADWLHHKADRYYCASCAADLNLASSLKGEPAVCSKRG